jgi:hypothetical protein
MLLTLFTIILAVVWFAFFLAAFCPLRAYRRRREIEGAEDV